MQNLLDDLSSKINIIEEKLRNSTNENLIREQALQK
jgi:hypothetical protein